MILRGLVFVCLTAMVPNAFACSCSQETTQQRYSDYDSVFIAEVTRTAPGTAFLWGFEGRGYRVYLRVVRSFKGPYRSGDLDVYQTFEPGGACGVDVAVGKQFLIYESRRPSRFLGMCNSRSGDPMIREVAEIEALRAKLNRAASRRK